MIELTGTGVAIVTPFHFSGEIDYSSLTKLINNIIENGIDFIVALGTTSEAVTLSASEKKDVMLHVKEVVAKRVPIVMGIGGNNTNAVVEDINNSDLEGISAILSVAPYYNKPNQRGIYEHFKAIAEVCPLPVILYNVPGRTSSNIAADTCIKLAHEFKNIVAVKEASGDLSQIMKIIESKPDGFEVLSGDDALTFPMITLGAEGVISVVANSFPREFSQMVNYARIGDVEDARNLHYRLLEFTGLIFEEGNPAGVKSALEIQGVMSNNLRLPMVPVSNELYMRITKEISEIEDSEKE